MLLPKLRRKQEILDTESVIGYTEHMTKPENEEAAHAIIEKFFLDQYKIDYGSKLLRGVTDTTERLNLWHGWEPDYGQRTQADANAQQLLDRLAINDLTFDAPPIQPANICTTDLSDISTVENCSTADEVNLLLQDGWTILHVGIDGNGFPLYMLGLAYEGIE